MKGLTISKQDGELTAKFCLDYPYDNFFSLYKDIKDVCSCLNLISINEEQEMIEGNMKMIHHIYFSDPFEQVRLRVSRGWFYIDFNDFFTIMGSFDQEEYVKLIETNLRRIEINIRSLSKNRVYSITFRGIKRILIMEDISKLSHYQQRKLLSGKRKIAFDEKVIEFLL